MTDRGPAITSRACPSDELLIAYLTTATKTTATNSARAGLPGTERSRIEEHLGTCDDCVQTLAIMQRRLGVASEIPAPAPASILERAGAAIQPVVADVQTVTATTRNSRLDVPHSLGGRLPSLRDRLSAVFRLPVLVPAAVAAVALLVIVRQQGWMNPVPPPEMSRVIERHETLRVTADEALVRVQPALRHPVVATVKRGTSVEIIGEENDWYRVLLQDGREGWMDRRAFE